MEGTSSQVEGCKLQYLASDPKTLPIDPQGYYKIQEYVIIMMTILWKNVTALAKE